MVPEAFSSQYPVGAVGNRAYRWGVMGFESLRGTGFPRATGPESVSVRLVPLKLQFGETEKNPAAGLT